MASYYYFAAQLPYLVYGQPEPMSSGHFRELCTSFLNAGDRRRLEQCRLDISAKSRQPPPPETAGASSFLDNWEEWEGALRLNLARLRAQHLKREGAAPDAPGYPADAVHAAKAACAMDSPLEAELFLDKTRWDAIERLRGLDNFGSDFIFAYLLKLLLMERKTSFKTEKGFMEYKTLYAAIVNNYGGAESGEPK